MSACRETYCINVPSESGSTTRLIGLDDVGFSEATGVDLGGEPIFAGGVADAEPVFEIPFGAAVRFYNKGSVEHIVAAVDGSWTVTIPAASNAIAPLSTETFSRVPFHCPTHLSVA